MRTRSSFCPINPITSSTLFWGGVRVGEGGGGHHVHASCGNLREISDSSTSFEFLGVAQRLRNGRFSAARSASTRRNRFPTRDSPKSALCSNTTGMNGTAKISLHSPLHRESSDELFHKEEDLGETYLKREGPQPPLQCKNCVSGTPPAKQEHSDTFSRLPGDYFWASGPSLE